MAMSKKQLREWPWNNMPSKRHVWTEIRSEQTNGYKGASYWHTAKCERCGCRFVSRADTRAPVYCYATPEWLASHPEDDGKQGP